MKPFKGTAPSWMRKTGTMYRSLNERGRCNFELAKFRAWLCCQSQNPAEDKDRLVWKCAYTGDLLTLGDISCDHKLPVTAVRVTTLDNLCVTSEPTNRRKGRMTDYEFRMLLKLTREHFTIAGREDLMRRLAAKPAWGRKSH